MGWATRLGAAGASSARTAERTLHRLARPAAFALAPMLLRQSKRLLAALPGLPEPRGRRDGTVGERFEGTPVRLLVVGDSTATGVGVDRLEETLAVQLAERLAAARERPVRWRIEGQEGSTAAAVLSRDLANIDRRAEQPWDAILVLIGANDALQLVSRSAFARSARALLAGLDAHRADGGVIGVAGTPQIDTFAWLPQPMRSLLGGHARSLDEALQRIAAEAAHIVHLPTPAILEPRWHAADGFHPSPAGYGEWARLIAPRILAALPPGAPAPRGSEAAALEASAEHARRGIVPPYLLERLATADSAAAPVAQRTLGVDRDVRAE
ncbi:SGNH/GDSL hydrolase family protein, partial [Agrococcus sp. HG114]|uniref:SGNH/GDSL hydrolase family protein n=1 Tax=Agrococcus sp. HG114 TaxID=2969757 RepID=UPI00215AB865